MPHGDDPHRLHALKFSWVDHTVTMYHYGHKKIWVENCILGWSGCEGIMFRAKASSSTQFFLIH